MQKPARVDDRFEKNKSFGHPILQICGHAHQGEATTGTYLTTITDIIVRERNAENDTCHPLKEMDPLFPFTPLTGDVTEAK